MQVRKAKDDIDKQCAHISLKITKIKLVLGPPPGTVAAGDAKLAEEHKAP